MRKNLHINENLPEDILESIVISSTEYAIIATDIHNRIIIWNKGAELIYGYSKEEMLGKQFPPDLHRKGLPNNEFLFVPNNETKSRLIDQTMYAKRKDGTFIPISITSTPRVNKNSKTLGLLILTRDITRYKLLDQFNSVLIEITHLINSSSSIDQMCSEVCNAISSFLGLPAVFICLFDRPGNFFYINAMTGLCKNCTGHTCGYHTCAKDVAENIKGCFKTYTQLTINHSPLSEHAIYEYMEAHLPGRGENFIIHIPLISDVSIMGILHIVVSEPQKTFLLKESQILSLVANEITTGIQRKRLIEEIKEYADNLEKMVKERTRELREKDAQLVQSEKLATLGEMATGIAHEINQPLGGISLITQGLILAKKRNKLTDEMLLEKLNAIIEQVDRIDKIIGHLRTFARQSDQTKTPVNIKMPLTDVFKLIGEQLKRQQISVDMDIEENLPYVLADHNRLEQVFLNLIINAKDALNEREKVQQRLVSENDADGQIVPPDKKITIKAFSDNKHVIIEITDNGIGISKSIINKIFEPFFTTKEVGKGTGIGLSISYGIVKEFNGTIEVESEEMKGSKFIIKFPIYKENSMQK
ncbi:MAG TPA: PAS domain S-box protein [Hungateiclostridium thermocellum]|uniref:histidine kinase n=1 Tax=Acetivibrio thermocellus (strain ATCC 27405 / DSM 1237 / JCM 9322 / NBRC 103400 / NCIMB 10682 / NRRL B-4536 / VPI 7372) TaxID=203119 RepID=A3DCY9_ACET2|nr:ATP-binding protein [Acetivibrio thermocellus]ABN51818.1 multi-sensor signal transduction histidine kinase [Acetivibrio thermocellus ATCC 27405]HBW26983.1 PAS domain S-box protein [Acetivibrio thermocellus]